MVFIYFYYVFLKDESNKLWMNIFEWKIRTLGAKNVFQNKIDDVGQNLVSEKCRN